MRHKRYLLWMLLLCGLTLLPAIALNLVLLRNEGDIKAMSFAASDWQQQTHGITFSPTLGNNGFFKTLRLNDRLPDINTVVLGASTAFTISDDMLPAGWELYNFAQSGSPLRNSIAQAEYLMEHAPQIRHYIIMMDWSLDFIYDQQDLPAVDLSRPGRSQALSRGKASSLAAMLLEASSYPRMSKLWQILRSVGRAQDPQDAFRQYFLQPGSDEYVCPDGKSRGKDFGVYNRGSCNGFRYKDGSATFSDYTRVDNVAPLIVSSASSSSQYARALLHTQGVPSQKLLDRLSAMNDVLSKRGSQLILIVPPLVPGMEQAFMHSPQLSPYLVTTKQSLADWSRIHDIALFDFGQSERYGCRPDEFIDPHHAVQSCYQKAFAGFWGKARRPSGKLLLPGGEQ